jgi:hypothetical protein
MTTRRGFLAGLAGILASGFAPAAVGSQVLMPVRKIVTPLLTPITEIEHPIGVGLEHSTLPRLGARDFYFDASDMHTLFQDAEGRVPVTGVGQQVKLMLPTNGDRRLAATVQGPALYLREAGRGFISWEVQRKVDKAPGSAGE